MGSLLSSEVRERSEALWGEGQGLSSRDAPENLKREEKAGGSSGAGATEAEMGRQE